MPLVMPLVSNNGYTFVLRCVQSRLCFFLPTLARINLPSRARTASKHNSFRGTQRTRVLARRSACGGGQPHLQHAGAPCHRSALMPRPMEPYLVAGRGGGAGSLENTMRCLVGQLQLGHRPRSARPATDRVPVRTLQEIPVPMAFAMHSMITVSCRRPSTFLRCAAARPTASCGAAHANAPPCGRRTRPRASRWK